MGGGFASNILKCYFLQEKNKDGNDVVQGAFDILDEFVEAFGKTRIRTLI